MTDAAPSGRSSSSATLACPTCQTSITYYDVSGSSYYGCSNCHTFFKYEDEEAPVALTTFTNTTLAPTLPIGSEGYLNGQFIRVVGFMNKKEANAPYNWSEYMLLQKDGRTSQLAEYNGHWILIEPTDKTYSHYHVGGQTYYIKTDDRKYWLYNRYTAEVVDAIGEFDWNILEDTQLTVSEYIDPPYMLVGEQNENQSTWYKANHLARKDLAAAFAIDPNNLPIPYGVGALEPADPENRWRTVVKFTGILLAALWLCQIVISVVKSSKPLFRESYQIESDSTGIIKPIVSPSFEVDGPVALAFDMHADINNQWLELPVTLINEQTGKVYEFTKTLEYYYGVEDGESWSEGSRDNKAILSRIPTGKYHLNIYPTSDGKYVSFRIGVEQKTFLEANIGLFLLLLAIYPIFLYVSRFWHDGQRWSNSDFSKVYTESDNS
ncbi:DUF4178 domain-containing protein [Spirosoma litoris]